ncbi:MAG: malate/lactate/ureidoglycolate dehydrogenase [Acidimicrobiales bacterium]|nr:malate/lactate/ureidoglycolate dehydrogenase [Acidimicrobiales bacterium]
MPGFTPQRLHEFTRSVVAALGSRDPEPALVADQLIRANLCGHDSHGIGMLPLYVDAASTGGLRVNAEPETIIDSGSIVVLDGQHGFGQVMGHRAMKTGIERVADHGVALIGLRNSFHIGRIGHWGEQAAAAGMVSLHFVNVAGHEPMVAPYGGASARFGTNPVCIAIPAAGQGEPLALLDMATSTIALGKTRVAKNKGEQVPEGTLLDPAGRLTTDPNVMWDDGPSGALVAMGDHKGSGLALMCEILGAALLGGDTIDPRYERSGSVINSMLTILIDPAAVGDPAGLQRDTHGFLDYVKQSALREGFNEVLVPGEPEARSRHERAREVPIDDATVGELNAAAARVGVDLLR